MSPPRKRREEEAIRLQGAPDLGRAPGRSLVHCSASAETARSRLAGAKGRSLLVADDGGAAARASRRSRRTTRSTWPEAASRSARSGQRAADIGGEREMAVDGRQALDQVVGGAARRKSRRHRVASARRRRGEEGRSKMWVGPAMSGVMASQSLSKSRPAGASRSHKRVAVRRVAASRRSGLSSDEGRSSATPEPAPRLAGTPAPAAARSAASLDLALPPHCLACERRVASEGTLCAACWGAAADREALLRATRHSVRL